MRKKPKFNPRVNRVKLHPEQAVLNCACCTQGWQFTGTGGGYEACLLTRGEITMSRGNPGTRQS